MGTIEIRKIGITDLDTDAIVNAANEGLQAGGGVCGAIFKVAGHGQLKAACNEIGHCDTGSAVITPGFGLKAKYIIHAVGPVWSGGHRSEPKLLYGAYRRSLELAAENGCASIGFPLISAGIFGYPMDQAWRKAIQACSDFLGKGNQIDIVFAVLDDKILETGVRTLNEIAPQFAVDAKSGAAHPAKAGGAADAKSGGTAHAKKAVKSNWKTSDMPKAHDTFILNRNFTSNQMNTLRRGHIPREMEDKWFWYMEGDTLYAHRSWTGFCIFRIDFSEDGRHRVTVNRDPQQYKSTDLEEDRQMLNKLLNWWTGVPYDYYGEWLSETVDKLQKAGVIKD